MDTSTSTDTVTSSGLVIDPRELERLISLLITQAIIEFRRANVSNLGHFLVDVSGYADIPDEVTSRCGISMFAINVEPSGGDGNPTYWFMATDLKWLEVVFDVYTHRYVSHRFATLPEFIVMYTGQYQLHLGDQRVLRHIVLRLQAGSRWIAESNPERKIGLDALTAVLNNPVARIDALVAASTT